MKRNLTFLLLALALTLSCSKNDKNERGEQLNRKEIVGTWYLKGRFNDGMTLPAGGCNTRTNIVFREDNTFTIDEYRFINENVRCENRKSSGTYDLSRQMLRFGPYYERFFHITDNKLFLEDGSSQQIFVRITP